MTRETVQQLVDDLERIGGRLGDQGEVLDACLPVIQEGIAEHFQRAQSPRGHGWPARKNPKPQHPLLNQTGALRTAATGKGAASVKRIEGGRTLVVGVDKSAGSGSIRGAGRHQHGDSPAGILPRPFVGISDETAEKCEAIIAAWWVDELAANPHLSGEVV